MNATTIISIIAALGLGTPITVLLTGILNRKKNNTDGASVVQGMAIGVAQEIRTQLTDVRTELDKVKAELLKAQGEIVVLNASLNKALERAQDAEDDRDKLKQSWPPGQPMPVI